MPYFQSIVSVQASGIDGVGCSRIEESLLFLSGGISMQLHPSHYVSVIAQSRHIIWMAIVLCLH